MRYYKNYILRKGSEIHSFDTLGECARFLGINVKTLYDCRFRDEPFCGWVVQKNLEAARYSVVATIPTGERIYFQDIYDAANVLRCSGTAIAKSIDTRSNYGGWRWDWARLLDLDDIEFNELTEEIRKTFYVVRKERKVRQGGPAMAEIDDEDRFEGRKPIATGYIASEFSPIVCPICGKVMPNRRENIRHLDKCLKGHEYTIKLNRIKVWE